MRTFITISFICSLLPISTSFAADPLNLEGDLPKKQEYQDRQQRVSQWYAPARFGLFCHWGMFTGVDPSTKTFAYKNVAEFEAAANDPDLIASNLVATAKRMGARYLTFTLLHSGDHYTVLFPAKTPGFKMKTTKDYIGALAARCRQEQLPLMLYLCGQGEHGFGKRGNWLEEPMKDVTNYVKATEGLLDELAALHPGEISGFWIDGQPSQLPKYMKEHFPNCIVIHNNDDNFGWGETGDPYMDYGTTEFLSGTANPDYSRPSGLVQTHSRWDLLPPRRDYNEDIPVVGSWWYQSGKNGDGYSDSRYAKSPTLVVKEMVSSLGQRREWNFAIGVGPMIDGKFAPSLQPMVESLHNFFAWGAESIYNTIGGEGSALIPGWWNKGAYGSVTVSLKDPKILYVHVTTAPESGDTLRVPNNGYKIASVIDLRTGQPVDFIDIGVLVIKNKDWSDVTTYGDKVFKVTLSGTP